MRFLTLGVVLCLMGCAETQMRIYPFDELLIERERKKAKNRFPSVFEQHQRMHQMAIEKNI